MKLSGWGRYPIITSDAFHFHQQEALQQYFSQDVNCISFGKGRSYGDSALADHTLHTDLFNHFLNFNEQTGILTCESGVSLAEILAVFVPRGWFLEITPGTKYISVGGAIASDVHGKNHHVNGCFSNSVLSFNLMLSDGTIQECSREKNRILFNATCGGMGLTGVILTARFRLRQIPSSMIAQTTLKAKNLDETLDLFDQYKHYPYSVAWVDCLAKGKQLGRSLLMVGDHAKSEKRQIAANPKLTFPFNLPSFALNRYSVSAFNLLYYHRITRKEKKNLTSLDSFFYPLDAIHLWNRMYGSAGFTQYQFVIPLASSAQGLRKIFNIISNSGLGSFLSVLKLLGSSNDNYLSFPMEGYTLALDFKIEPRLFPLLDQLDKIVIDYGGRLYLAKDVRMSPETLKKGYQHLDKFQMIRETNAFKATFNSKQSIRLGL
jgi:decaprenylphospho-beta-D-ribofuranose 2-oxidase